MIILCPHCGNPQTRYGKKQKRGWRYYCLHCIRQQRSGNKKLLEYRRLYRVAHPEQSKFYKTHNREKILAKNKIYYAKNKEMLSARRHDRWVRDKKNYENNFLTIVPDSQYINTAGYVKLRFGLYATAEHIHIMRKKMGKYFNLKDGEVHHINGIPNDNRIDNLEFIPKYPFKRKHRVIDELHKALKTIASQDQEIARLKELINSGGVPSSF